ncbi:unnamed protein product [Linum trigynum]|uniref:Glyoxalase/fosfomycin resistance/dioxygenase domain-containing protein n=1 Tax=Linum trigynum TaxID=586398 RepID=A0AAV2D460_9ROSI
MAAASSITTALSRLPLSRLCARPALPSLFSSYPSLFRPKAQNWNRLRSFSSMAASESKDSPASNPGLHTSPDEATKGYFMQQTMFRIKDPKVSLDFYSRVLGMTLLKRLDFPEMKFSLYFMGYE